MPINPKPFNFSEQLRRVIFKSRPAFFNVEDLNKELMVIHYFVEEFNKMFGVASDIKFTFNSIGEVYDAGTNTITRSIGLSWNTSYVLYKGARIQIGANTYNGYTQSFPKPDDSTTPKAPKPVTYIVLTAQLDTVTFGTNPILCGLNGTEFPQSVDSVNVEQYSGISITMTSDPTTVPNALCVLGTVHPKYKADGSDDGYGLLYNVFRNPDTSLNNGSKVAPSVFKNNQSLYEYIVERTMVNTDRVLNERQLIQRFNLADLVDAKNARHNIGLSKVLNQTQLVKDAALGDIANKGLARQNLGLKAPATMTFGLSKDSIARGDMLPVGAIIMWSGEINTIPENWALCNGQTYNGVTTPDLSGRFMVSYKEQDAKFGILKGTGGNAGGTFSLLKSHLPKIKIGFSVFKSVFGSWDRSNGSARPISGVGDVHALDPGNSTSAGTGYTQEIGDGEPIDVMPPYYVLAFIMFTGYKTATQEPAVIAQPAIDYTSYSAPDNTTDGGFSTYTPTGVSGATGSQNVGAGVTLTNPE